MVPSMRVLFSSTRGAGHLQPLLPYARALVARGHEVAVAAPEGVSKTVRDAGLPLLPFDHPGDEALAPIWALDASGLRLQARRLAEEIAAMPTIDDVVDAMVGLT